MSPQPPTCRLEAELLVDTGFGSRRAGMRNGAGCRRQMLFRAGEIFLDLSLHRQVGTNHLALMGQLLDAGIASRNLADLPVELEFADGEQARTRSNGLGEFLLTGVAVENATLGISLDRWTSLQIPLPAVALPEEAR